MLLLFSPQRYCHLRHGGFMDYRKQNSNFLQILVYGYPWRRALARLCATPGMTTALSWWRQICSTCSSQGRWADTSKFTPDQPQHLCSSFIPSLHFCNTCLETRGLPAVAGVVSKLLCHWMNTCEIVLCIWTNMLAIFVIDYSQRTL